MTEEEIKLRCVEMAFNQFKGSRISLIVLEGHNLFEQVYPYIKEGKLLERDNS